MIRGINKQSILSDDEDNEKFLTVLNDCKELCRFELYGYCLMSNHVHLLLKEADESIGQIVKRISSRYVLWFNRKYMRSGHLYQERYRSEAVDDDQYFVTVLRYIHQNPKASGLCESISDYKWSSYNEYITQCKVVNIEFALSLIGKENYVGFMNESNKDSCLEYTIVKKTLTDAEVAEIIEAKFKVNALMVLNEKREIAEYICKEVLKIEGISTRQLSRVTGIPINFIWKL